MKHTFRVLICGLIAAIPLLLVAGCYTQVGTARGDADEGYDNQSASNDQTQGDSTQPGDYDSARREFYSSYYYPPDYPAYSVGIGYGWGSPWYGYGYPWYFYDSYPWYGGFSPYAYWYPHGYGGYYNHGGGYGYYGRPYATRRYGMSRSSGGTRGGYAVPTGGYTGSANPAGRTGAIRGAASNGRMNARGPAVTGTAPTRGRASAGVSQRNRSGMRGPAARSAPSGNTTARSGGRGSSAPAGHSAPSGGGGTRGGGGGGGSRSGGGGGGSSRGGGGGRR
jgi:hypothetical protein